MELYLVRDCWGHYFIFPTLHGIKRKLIPPCNDEDGKSKYAYYPGNLGDMCCLTRKDCGKIFKRVLKRSTALIVLPGESGAMNFKKVKHYDG